MSEHEKCSPLGEDVLENACPCGSGMSLRACCAPYFEGALFPDAAALVRARYTAFCLCQYQFLIDTTHPDFRADMTVANLSEGLEHVRWLRLELGEMQKDVVLGNEGAFDNLLLRAYYEQDGHEQVLEELSFFKWEGEHLYYVDGVSPKKTVRRSPKTGRNDPCVCGSGKKYKKCCGAV